MNRRRMLSSVHRSIARHASAQVGADHSTVSRMSIADLDRIGPRLVTTQASAPEATACFYCAEPADSDHFPYCSSRCAVNASEDR